MSDRRREMLERSRQAIFDVASDAARSTPLEQIVVVVADEHDEAARLVLDPLGVGGVDAARPGEVCVAVFHVLRERLASIIARFDADMAARLRDVQQRKVCILVVGDGGAETAHLRFQVQGSA